MESGQRAWIDGAIDPALFLPGRSKVEVRLKADKPKPGQTAVVTLLAGETEVTKLTIALTDAASEKEFVMAIDQPTSVDFMTITTDGDSVHLLSVTSLPPK